MEDLTEDLVYDLIGEFLSGIENLPELRNIIGDENMDMLGHACSYLALIEENMGLEDS